MVRRSSTRLAATLVVVASFVAAPVAANDREERTP